MKEFIGTNVQTETTGTINTGITDLTDYNASGNAHGLGEIVVLGSVGGLPVAFKADGTDAVAKSINGFQIGVKTPTTVKWSGKIPNKRTTIVTKCLNRAAVASVKVYAMPIATNVIQGMIVGLLVDNLNYPFYMGTKRQKSFEYTLTAADITSYAINSTGWTAITTAFNAKFNTKYNWCTMSSGSGTAFTITSNTAGVDFRVTGSMDTQVITTTTVSTANADAYNTGTLVKAEETSTATRSGYNPFWEIDANMWTSTSMINTSLLYTTYVIEYQINSIAGEVIPAFKTRECIVAIPKYSTGTTTNPDMTALDAMFTAMSNNASVASAAANTGTHAPATGNGLIFRTV